MILSIFCALILGAQLTSAQQYRQGYILNTTIAGNGTGQGPDGKYMIQAPSINASFIPLGATLTNLYIPDQQGIIRDVVLGYDTLAEYDGSWPRFGGVPGRYASPIANNSFIADGINSTVSRAGMDWDTRNWTVFAQTTDSITFYLSDPAVEIGFPGAVVAWVTYTVTELQLTVRMVAISLTSTTPIMMSQRAYWNLDGFQNPKDLTILNHTLYLPYSGQRTEVDSSGISTGVILPNTLNSVNDFWSSSSKPIGHNLTSPALANNCGLSCTGYATEHLVNRAPGGPYDWTERGPVAVLRSKWSGIRLNLFSDQDALFFDSCSNFNSQIPLKSSQRLANTSTTLQPYGCVGLHVRDQTAGVNHPEWLRDPKQLFGPGDPPYSLNVLYQFKLPTTTPHCTSTSTTSRSKSSSNPLPSSSKAAGVHTVTVTVTSTPAATGPTTAIATTTTMPTISGGFITSISASTSALPPLDCLDLC